MEMASDVVRVKRAGSLWWSSVGGPCGESSADRRDALATPV